MKAEPKTKGGDDNLNPTKETFRLVGALRIMSLVMAISIKTGPLLLASEKTVLTGFPNTGGCASG